LVISPNFSRDSTLLAGTVEDGVFRSADRGRSWSSWNFGLLDLNVFVLDISPAYASDETLFAGTESGIFKSTNGGRAWREVDLPIGFEPVLSLAVSPDYANDDTLFVGTESKGLLVSTDRGRTWDVIGEGTMMGPLNALVLSPTFPADPDMLVLRGDKLFLSPDRGRTWLEPATEPAATTGVTSVTAPHGIGPGAPLLLGLASGEVRLVSL
jgi:photosystem II stability/assembly factor-like uncharacterized protein